MITPDEAVRTMDAMIRSIPISFVERENFGFMVSKEVAGALYEYTKLMSDMPQMKIFKSGEEFTWKGFKCKVA